MEILAQNTQHIDIIIGIGLNVNSTEPPQGLDRPWCSLKSITGQNWDRNELIHAMITHIHRYLNLFYTHGLPFFIPTWEQMDYLYLKQINTMQDNHSLCGTAKGINDAGKLILVDKKGEVHYLSAGEVSLKAGLE